MSARDTGGPAFPRPSSPGDGSYSSSPQSGMTLRDYFAAQAMPMIARHRYDQLHDFSPEPIAHYAYVLADAMLAERKNLTDPGEP